MHCGTSETQTVSVSLRHHADAASDSTVKTDRLVFGLLLSSVTLLHRATAFPIRSLGQPSAGCLEITVNLTGSTKQGIIKRV